MRPFNLNDAQLTVLACGALFVYSAMLHTSIWQAFFKLLQEVFP